MVLLKLDGNAQPSNQNSNSNFAFANINFISARCSVKSMEPLRFIASSAFLTNASAASPVSTGTLLIAIAITVNTYVIFLCKNSKKKTIFQFFYCFSVNNHGLYAISDNIIKKKCLQALNINNDIREGVTPVLFGEVSHC